MEFDESAAKRNIQAVPPGMQVFILSAKTGEGMADYLNSSSVTAYLPGANAGVST